MYINKINSKKDLEEIFKTLNEEIFRYIYVKCGYNRELAEDLTQDVFVKVWEKRSTFDSHKSSLKNWIYTIAKNKVIDYYKSKKMQNNKYIDLQTSINEGLESAEKELMFNSVMKSLQALPDNDKDVLVLRYIQEFNINDISKVMNKSYIATKVMIFRAKKKLKKIISS